jgi:hypothetical protein
METPKEHSTFLWRTSWLSLVSCAYAIYQTHYHLAIVPGSVYLTSINYWRDPRKDSWRRTADIFVVYSSLAYQVLMTRNAENAYIYYFIILLCGLSYCGSLRYNGTWAGVYCHSAIHILGNVSNIVLYSGKIEKLCYTSVDK